MKKLLKVQTEILTALIGSIPSLPGLILRFLLYKTLFKKMGSFVKIYPDIRFNNPKGIVIGAGVILRKGVEFILDPDSQVELNNLVHLERDVRIIAIGKGSKIKLADQVRLDRGVELKAMTGCEMEIGKNSSISPYVHISGYGNLKIGEDCRIASHSSLCAYNHNFSDPNVKMKQQGHTAKGITIEDDCWLGGGVRVVDGVTICQGSVIGAGSVVTKDIPPYSIAVGVPAKVIDRRTYESDR